MANDLNTVEYTAKRLLNNFYEKLYQLVEDANLSAPQTFNLLTRLGIDEDEYWDFVEDYEA